MGLSVLIWQTGTEFSPSPSRTVEKVEMQERLSLVVNPGGFYKKRATSGTWCPGKKLWGEKGWCPSDSAGALAWEREGGQASGRGRSLGGAGRTVGASNLGPTGLGLNPGPTRYQLEATGKLMDLSEPRSPRLCSGGGSSEQSLRWVWEDHWDGEPSSP